MHEHNFTDSANIAKATWDSGKLVLTFVKGASYAYSDVPEGAYFGLVGAESAGKFFHASIKPHYAAVRLESAVSQ